MRSPYSMEGGKGGHSPPLAVTKPRHREGSEVRADAVVIHLLGLALDLRLGASSAGTRSTRRALRGLGALDLGAARTGARRALTLGGLALAAVQDDGLLLGDGRLEDVVAEVGNGRALGLQHVVAEFGARLARGHRRLQDIQTHIGHLCGRARRADWTRGATSTLCHRRVASPTDGCRGVAGETLTAHEGAQYVAGQETDKKY